MREDEGVKRVKVMQIIARMNVGGPAVIVAELMRSLNKEEFEQLLVTGYCDQNEADYLDEVATDISATRIAGLGRSVSPIADLRAFFSLVAMIRKFQPDVIHTHTAKAGVLGRLASILAGRRALRIHTFHGHLLHGYFSGWKTKLVIAIEKVFASQTDILIAIGTKVKDDLLAAGIGKASQYRVFFPGLPEPEQLSRSKARSALGWAQDGVVVTFVGRLTQIKRPDRLLDIAGNVSGAEFVIAGEGELSDSCKARAASEKLPVTFLGWRKDIETLLAASDIAILTSDNEGIPLTLIQASFVGLPILATKVGSISDIVIEGGNGFLLPPDAGAMAKALQELINRPEMRENMGKYGREHAQTHFSLSRMVKDHSDLYQQR